MQNHKLIGKLCHYKSIHFGKILFTFPLTDKPGNDSWTSYMEIPFWYYNKHFKGKLFPRPTTYNTPFVCVDNAPSYCQEQNIENFLVVDSCKFAMKIGKHVAGDRTFLKILTNENNEGLFCWVDSEWIEPYQGFATYTDLLKSKMRNKLNI